MSLDHLQLPFTEKYRLHESKELTMRNTVSPFKVAYMVILQQVIQTILGLYVLSEDFNEINMTLKDHFLRVEGINQSLGTGIIRLIGVANQNWILTCLKDGQISNWIYWWGIPSIQFLWAL